MLSGAPKGYDQGHPRIDLLRMKDIYAGKMLPPATLASAKALHHVTRVMKEAQPLAEWLRRHVGAKTSAR
ncbi:MAG: DUF2461 family protein [Vicinamibacterales bacterium]